MNLESDLDIFAAGEFSTPANVGGVLISGIFDEASSAAFYLDDSGTEQRRISLRCKTSDCANAVHGTPVIIKGRNYKIHSKEPIDDGLMTYLVLVPNNG